MEAVILIGIQASGKSTFYRQRLFATHVRVSLDLLRTRHRERSLVAWCLAHQQRFAVDNTNPTAAARAAYIAPARAHGFRVVGYYFESNVPASIVRNAGRSGRERVPEAAIGGTRRLLERPSPAEGFDALHFVRIGPDGGFVVEDWQDAV
ncbi:MAG TPA: AAA family ATPase [Roseiflexaceae bacterium]|nr:AAA family ATPase [Roseiflexaceae bacterium]